VGEASAHGPSVPDLHVPDVPERLDQKRAGAGHEGGSLHVSLPHHGADPKAAPLFRDPVQALDTTEVDEHVRPGQSEVQQRDQALPAREHLGIVTVVREDRESFLD
jgi:hypothetical protein